MSVPLERCRIRRQVSTPDRGPLAGVLVADFSRVVAGPYAAMLLGDLGADVVKVERPGAGDDTRGYGPPFVGGGETGETSSYYLSINRNKRAVAWDLAGPEGRRKARALAERADVVIENFKPGGAGKLGLDYAEITSANPGVVWCSISGFGSSGEGAALPGYDFLVQGVGGFMSITGDGGESGQPRKVGVAVIDVLTALFASNAVLAALVERSASGMGQRIEVDLLSCSLASLINQASTYLTTGSIPGAMANRHPSIAPYETLAAADRQFVVAVGNDGQFAALAGVVGKGWMASDERYFEERGASRESSRDDRRARGGAIGPAGSRVGRAVAGCGDTERPREQSRRGIRVGRESGALPGRAADEGVEWTVAGLPARSCRSGGEPHAPQPDAGVVPAPTASSGRALG